MITTESAYQELLARKSMRFSSVGCEVESLPKKLYDFQAKLTRWALKKGRAALWADTGLGKTFMQVSWANAIGNCLIVAPLCVSRQTIEEAKKLKITVGELGSSSPIQIIERCIRLWSNQGETVFSPFAGIGSEGYEALRNKRKFIGIELKREYFDVACRNLRNADRQIPLFGES